MLLKSLITGLERDGMIAFTALVASLALAVLLGYLHARRSANPDWPFFYLIAAVTLGPMAGAAALAISWVDWKAQDRAIVSLIEGGNITKVEKLHNRTVYEFQLPNGIFMRLIRWPFRPDYLQYSPIVVFGGVILAAIAVISSRLFMRGRVIHSPLAVDH